MVRLLVAPLFLFVGITTLRAQLPPQCPSNNHPAADFCQDICIYCNFNGYSGSSAGYTSQTPPGFCGTIENEQWLGFIAGASVGTFTVTPSNCQNGNGLQIALYTSCTSTPIACNGGGQGNGNNPVSITANLTPGVNYFLLIDGYAGDQCDFVVTVTPPAAAQAPPIAPTGAIQGPATVCPGGTVTFNIPPVSGAGAYQWDAPGGWSINGQGSSVTLDAPGGNVVTVTVGPTGGQICVQPISSCNNGNRVCRTINVQPIPPTNLSPVIVCNEDVPYTLPWGQQVSSSGLYQTTYQSYQGCDSVVRQQVTVKPPIVRNLGLQSICAGSCVTVCGQQFCDAGNYSYVCESYQGCDSLITFSITVVDPVAQITGGGVLTCSTPVVTLGSAPSPGTKVWRDGNGVVLGTGNTVSVSAPGMVILTVTAVAGGSQCVKTDTVVITANTTPPQVSAVGGFLGCGNSQAQLQATSSVPNSTFSWTPTAGLSNANIPNPLASLPGVYTVVVTSLVNGCTASATAQVTGNTEAPQVSATGGVLTCVDSTVVLQVSTNASAATYLWSGPAGFSSPAQSPVVSVGGTYTVTVTNVQNNCTASATAQVLVNRVPPGAVAVGGELSCTTPWVLLRGSSPTGGVSWRWSGPGGFSSTQQEVEVDTAGSYVLVVTGLDNGCTSTAVAVVIGDTLPPGAEAVGGQITCASPSLRLNGFSPAGGVSWYWSGPGGFESVEEDPVVSVAGEYVLVVTGANACTSSAVAEVTGDFATPDAVATGGVITCSSSTTFISGSSTTADVTYRWVGPNQGVYEGQMVEVSNIGVYTLVVTAANGCTATATAEVVPDENIPQVSAVGGVLNCEVKTVQLQGSSATPGATLVWSGPNGFTSTEEDPVVGVAGVYVLQATDPQNGCTAIATAPVVLDTLSPVFEVMGGVLTCKEPQLRLQVEGSTGGLTWRWVGPGGFESTDREPVVNVSGVYEVVARSANGCTAMRVAEVLSDQEGAELTVGGGVLTCEVNRVVLQAIANKSVSWQWSGPGGFVSVEQQPEVSVGGLYGVRATAQNGCVSVGEVLVEVDTVRPDAQAQGGTLTCEVQQVELIGQSQTPQVSYRWLGPGGLDTVDSRVVVSVGGAYTLVVRAANGCTSERTVDVLTDVEVPVVFATVSEELTCVRSSVRVEATATHSTSPTLAYWWSGPGGFESMEQDPLVEQEGVYRVVVTALNGCTAEAEVLVASDYALPQVWAIGDTLTCDKVEGQVTGYSQTPGVSYRWEGPNNFTSSQPSALVTAAGLYWLVVTGPNGCTSSAVVEVVLDADYPDVLAYKTNDLDCDEEVARLVVVSGTSGVRYEWRDAQGVLSVDAQVEVNVGGIYTVRVIGQNGCVSTAEVVVGEDRTPPGAVAVGDTIDCISGVARLVGESSAVGATYRWMGPGGVMYSGSVIEVNVAGLYELVVTGGNGCTSEASAVAWSNVDAPEVEIVGGGTLTCSVPQLTLRGRIYTVGAAGVWQGPGGFGSMDSVIVVNVSGLYRYVVTGLNGCVTTREVEIKEDFELPQDVVVLGGKLTCSQPQVRLQASSSTPNVSYRWSGPGGFTATQPNPVVSVSGTYTVVVRNTQNGCEAVAVTQVSEDTEPPTVSLSAGELSCKVGVVKIESVVSPLGVTSLWVGPGIDASNQTLRSPEVSVAGVYTVTVRRLSNGCTASASIEVVRDGRVSEGVEVFGGELTCRDRRLRLRVSTLTVGSTYVWSGPGGFTSLEAEPEVSEGGLYTVVVTHPESGCTVVREVEVRVNQQPPSVTVQGGILTCRQPSLVLLGSSTPAVGVLWSWSGPGGFASSERSPQVSVGGAYTAVVTDEANGCTSSAVATVLSDQQGPQVVIGPVPPLTCNTTQVTLTAQVIPSGVYTYEWSTQGGQLVSGSTSATATAGRPGVYQVVVTAQQNGCTGLGTVQVRADSATISGAQVAARAVTCYGRKDGLVRVIGVEGGTPPYLYALNAASLSPQVEFSGLAPGKYRLTIQDANGCEWEEEVEVGEPAELRVELGGDTTIHLGDGIRLDLSAVVSDPGRVKSSRLEPAEWLDSLGRELYPLHSFRYSLTVVDTNGCRASDSRLVIVDKTRFVYIPNAFVPGSGENGWFYVSARYPRHVVRIKSLLVFDRWGSLVFERYNFAPNDPVLGWDGTVRGSRGLPGVYVYYAEVEFVDGETILYKGDVTLMQ